MASDKVYCDFQMTIEKAFEMLTVLTELRRKGSHPLLETTFRDMESQIVESIGYAASEKSGLVRSRPKQ
ncbi:hypothetical protein PSE10B_53770 [Pseudomonas amygdali pv. eriobotryae]|uniref:Uncharacterized protein n=1 Tax=Pseudomonas amygdali pv. eriobotryae TaxID=129137 RepID=A0A9P3EFD5_PSEA0|nr:hypothetical protein PSE10A_53360 [Pseudomonas amygdali pv. eriobotryae]GFZ68855.1 hypothetical protein PSE10B_53770 [Pseudomonas amygdali pv. eriobotryae]